MKNFFSIRRFKKKKFDDDDLLESEDEYVELDTESEGGASSKVVVRPFILDDFSDIKGVIDVLREGYTIAIINIKPLKERDIVELKRAINKLKKTCEAIDGDIAGFGDDYIVIAPNFAQIYRGSETSAVEDEE
ncbi:MAG: cell division protein SepF [Candidatus Woesearchaeota archaeon]